MTNPLIIDTHPTSYRSQLYSKLIVPELHLAYLSGYSLNKHKDLDFNQSIVDTGILPSNHNTYYLSSTPPTTSLFYNLYLFYKLIILIYRLRPSTILLTSINYPCLLALPFFAKYLFKSRIGLRVETNDHTSHRNPLKSFLRSIFYKIVYLPVDVGLAIGCLNSEHLSSHGIPLKNQIFTPYTCDISSSVYRSIDAPKLSLREKLDLPVDHTIVLLSGKLTPKKNFIFVLNAFLTLFSRSQPPSPITLLIAGNGEQHELLRERANYMQKLTGITTIFLGYVEPHKLSDFYKASDILILPSERQGETWGIVATEAYIHGCRLLLSDSVGCAFDYQLLPNVYIYSSNSHISFARSLRLILLNDQTLDLAEWHSLYSLPIAIRSLDYFLTSR